MYVNEHIHTAYRQPFATGPMRSYEREKRNKPGNSRRISKHIAMVIVARKLLTLLSIDTRLLPAITNLLSGNYVPTNFLPDFGDCAGLQIHHCCTAHIPEILVLGLWRERLST